MSDSKREGPVSFVTGGSAGLGAAVAERLVERGDRVVVADLAAPPDALAARVRFAETDVTDPASVQRTIASVADREGRLDALVNAVGIWFRRPFLEIDADEWDRVFAVNLRGPFLACQAAAPLMQATGGGAIVNIGSQAGVGYTRGQGAHYHATKAGLVHLTRVLAFELGPMGVRINCVAPGAIDRPRAEPLSPEQQATSDRFLEQTPQGRFVTSEEVVSSVAFLCSGESSGITGQTVLVNGGALGYV